MAKKVKAPKIKKKDAIVFTPELIGRLSFNLLTGKEPTLEEMDAILDKIQNILDTPYP